MTVTQHPVVTKPPVPTPPLESTPTHALTPIGIGKSPPIVDPANLPEKGISFTCKDGVWTVQLYQTGPTYFFTERDFGRVAILISRRTQLRMKAAELFNSYRK